MDDSTSKILSLRTPYPDLKSRHQERPNIMSMATEQLNLSQREHRWLYLEWAGSGELRGKSGPPKGVSSTQVGFAGGYTYNPIYKEVCSGKTGQVDIVQVVHQQEHISFEELLKVFRENQDLMQGARQDNDRGTRYHSAIIPTSAEGVGAALRSKEDYQKRNRS